ncbi:MAG: hypothetical protein L0216_05310 [Planctomycetales bacterium]|nr:hypothetical protein [Planctomycetales bacterium]
MRPLPPLALALALTAALAPSARSDGDEPLALPAPAVPILRVEELRQGMKGYGLTVLKGTQIVRFDVTVVDILKNFFPRQDLILIRFSGQNLEHTGIIGGMSGSPVYVEDKLIGAVAYGWSFPKDPMGGVTPIESMLLDGDRKSERAVEWAPGAAPRPRGTPGEWDARPIATPLVVSGLTERGLAALRESLEPWGIVPMRGGGAAAGRPEAEETRLEPGAALGVQLATGDVDMTAIGTVTYVDPARRQVLGFGHPFFSGGEHEMPMTTAVIHDVFASLGRSFKFGSPLRVAGAMTGDRPSCIAGVLGREPPMVPVDVSVENARTGRRMRYHSKVVQHEFFTPMLARTVGMDCADAAEQGMGDTAVETRLTFKVVGEEPVTITDIEGDTFSTLPWTTFFPLSAVLGNPWKKVKLESVDLSMKVIHEIRTARFVTLEASRSRVRPGESVTYRVELQPFAKPVAFREVTFTVPEDLPPGSYTVTVGTGASVPRVAPVPEDVPGLLRALRAQDGFRSDALYAILARPEMGLQVKGEVYRDLPASGLAALMPPHESGGRARLVSSAVVSPGTPTDWVVFGTRQASLEVLPAKR